MNQPMHHPPKAWQILNLAGIPFYIEAGFLLFIGIIVLMILQQTSSFALAGLIGFMVFFSLIVHEGGHALTARLLGLRDLSVTLVMFGGHTRHPLTTHGRSLLIILSGPAASLLLSALGWAVVHVDALNQGQSAAIMLGHNFFFWNLVWFLFNMLPIYPLDGGQASLHGLAMFIDARRAMTLVAWVSIVLAGCGAALAFYIEYLFAAFFLMMFAAQNVRLLKALKANEFID